MSRLRVKICGITRPEDAALAAELGADAVGMIFVPTSPRYLSDPGAVREILTAVRPLATPVGLFFDPSAAEVEGALEVAPDLVLQFQGSESPTFCAGFDRPYIKGVRMAPAPQPEQMLAEHGASASAFLFDSFRRGVSGGTGQRFDWSRLGGLVEAVPKPWLLAGGLNADNLAEAAGHNPWGLDLASGVESAPGVKDPERMRQFFRTLATLERAS